MNGVILKAGGIFSNASKISGEYYGLEIYGGTGTVTNTGSIAATSLTNSYGVLLKDGGSIANRAGGYIGGYTAISLLYGGTIKNAAGATIAATFDSLRTAAVHVEGAAGKISNSGTIYALDDLPGASTIYFAHGGSVTNALTGRILGEIYESAIFIEGNDGRVTNSGLISGGQGSVSMDDDATVTNTGTIDGGISVGARATVTNSGSIFGGEFFNGLGGFTGVRLGAGATVVNQAGGAIHGGGLGAYGIFIQGGGSIQNAGKISGASGAIRFKGSGANTLTLKTGSLLKGAVIGSKAKGASNKLVLEGSGTANNAFYHFDELSMASGGTWTLGGVATIGATKLSAGTLLITGDLSTALNETATSVVEVGEGGELKLGNDSFLGGTGDFRNEGVVTQSGAVTWGDANGEATILSNMATAIWDIAGGGGITSGTSAASSILNAGLIEDTAAGVSVISPALANDGAVLVSSGTLDFTNAVSGAGSDTISGAATLEFDQSVTDGQTIDFTGAGGVLDLGSPASFSGALSGYGAGDAVSLIGSWSITGFSQNGASQGTLTLSNFWQRASLTFYGSHGASLFDAVSSAGHTTITYA